MEMEFSHRDVDHARIVDVKGALNILNANDLRDFFEECVAQNHTKIVLNLHGVHYIDSSGLGTLIKAKTDIRKAGGNLILINVGESVDDVFRVTGVTVFLEIHESEEDALASLED